MSVVLATSRDGLAAAWDGAWAAVTGTPAALPAARRISGLGATLEQAFDHIRDDWWRLGARLGADANGALAHAASCAPYASDLGLMMAWRRLVGQWAAEERSILVLCDDPWVFRELAAMPGVAARAYPGRAGPLLRAALRGVAARLAVAARAGAAAGRLRHGRWTATGGSFLLVYGHPRSAPGHDAYFGDLMAHIPALRRLVHTDDFRVAAGLAADGRTQSLHAYGAPLYALLALPFVRWRPSRAAKLGAYGWLVRRAGVVEGRGGAAAMTAWQIHCQNRWLARCRPRCVAWPWENHPWERALVRAARAASIATVGYQHTDAGPHQFNMSPLATPGGLHDLPDRLVLNGPAYRQQFIDWGIPAERLVIGGAFRLPIAAGAHYDRRGPIFVALSASPDISREMMEAVRAAARPGRRFLVKPHPMYAFAVTESDGVERTDRPFGEHKSVSALVYGTGTSGLEGLIAGVPTYRVLPSDRVGLETMPDGLRARTVTPDTLDTALTEDGAPSAIDVASFFTPVNLDVWRAQLLAS